MSTTTEVTISSEADRGDGVMATVTVPQARLAAFRDAAWAQIESDTDWVNQSKTGGFSREVQAADLDGASHALRASLAIWEQLTAESDSDVDVIGDQGAIEGVLHNLGMALTMELDTIFGHSPVEWETVNRLTEALWWVNAQAMTLHLKTAEVG